VRAFEIALMCMVVASVVAAQPFSRDGAKRLPAAVRWICLFLLAAVVAIHALWEGAHWQMVPAYGAAFLVGALVIQVGWARWARIGCACMVLILAMASCGLSYVLPMFQLPMPTGPYAIGTRIVSMVDPSRVEDAEPSGQHRREVVVQIWYPALSSHAPRAPYRRRSETSLASSYQSVNWTHARYDAPAAEAPGGFPILIYNPGWNGRRTQDTPLVEELASHGYVVVGIDHPYNSGPVALSDGRVIKPVAAPELFDDVTSEAGVYALINKEADKETEDSLFVLDQVERMNDDAADVLYHRLDRSRIGALGFSLGGIVAANLAYRDARVGAVLDLDTPLYGDAGKIGITQPFMLISEDQVRVTPEEKARMRFGELRDVKMDEQDYDHQLPLFQRRGNYEFAVHGTVHSSFQDVSLTSPIRSISQAGAIDPYRMMEILRRYSVAFFDQSLRGIASPLLSAKKSPFAEVTVMYASEAREQGGGDQSFRSK
jgi:dienelactone hydrolase